MMLAAAMLTSSIISPIGNVTVRATETELINTETELVSEERNTESKLLEEISTQEEKVIKESKTVSAQEKFVSIEIKADENGFCIEDGVLTKYTGNAEEVTIPSDVTVIGSLAFENCETVKKVIIPGNVKTIKEKAFMGCLNLERVILKEGVETIEAYGLAKSSEAEYKDLLREVVIPSSVTSIGNNAFHGNWKFGYSNNEHLYRGHEIYVNKGSYAEKYLSSTDEVVKRTNVIYENGTVICYGHTMVGYRGKDSSVSIPENVTFIADGAFRENKNITKIVIPEGVTEIGCEVFCQCENLKEIVIPASVTNITMVHEDWDGAFCGVSEDLVVYGEKDSYAQKFAEEENFTFKVLGETKVSDHFPLYFEIGKKE